MSKPFQFCPYCGTGLSNQNHGGQARASCPGCGFVHWNNPTPVVAALMQLDSGEVVLVHNAQWPTKMYGLVSGFLEAGESPEQAVIREVREELGMTCDLAGLIGLYSWAPMNQLIIAYHVRATGPITLGEELDDYKLLTPDRLRPWPFGTGLAVADWLKRDQQARQIG